MPTIVKKTPRGYLVIDAFSGQPVIFRTFKNKREALQAAASLGGYGF